MAIDRTVKWRCQWQGKNGWANMLEIIPAGEFLSATDLTINQFSRAAFEMDFAEFGFEDLPIGMQKSQAASFSFDWGNLPSGLKELLTTPQYVTSGDVEITTLFTYYNDEGTNTLILQYCGAQSNKFGNNFEYKYSSIIGDVQIETVDLLKTILDTIKITNSYLYNYPETYSTEITQYYVDLLIVDFSDDNRWKLDVPPNFPNGNWRYILYSIEDFRFALSVTLIDWLAVWTRSGTGTYRQTQPQTGYPDASLTFYKQTRTDAHTKGAALDETNTLIMGFVATYDGSGYTPLGGIFSEESEGAGALFDSMGTFLAALAENFVCKLQFRAITQVNGVSGKTLITYEMFWLKPFENVLSPVTLTPKITTDTFEVETAGNVFLIAESEIPNMDGDDINQNRVSITVSDKTDTWGVKCLLHNVPTMRNVEGGTFLNNDPYNKITNKVKPNKLLYRESVEEFRTFKVHESVVINDGVNTHTLDSPYPFENEQWYDGTVDGWVIATQLYRGLPQAICEYITTYWADRKQAVRKFSCEMVTGEIVPMQYGDYFNLPALSESGTGATSHLLTIKPDWDLGIMDCTFLSRAI